MRREEFDYCVFLKNRANLFGVLRVYDCLLKHYPQFSTWAGSHNKILHHCEPNGLARHTSEIVELGIQVISTLHLQTDTDYTEFYLAALFHDTGKMFDYKLAHNASIYGDLRSDSWEPTEHRRLIYHIPRSTLIFHDIAKETDVPEELQNRVLHAILSHHGAREHGSPVAPKSRVAWLLHLCDSLSARMDDCERLDVLNKK